MQGVINYLKEVKDTAKYLIQGLGVTFDHMRRRPVTIQYPYEKLIPSERYRGRIHFEMDKCIACEVCVRVCPINLPVVDWVMNKEAKKKELRNYSIDFGACIFCGNCVEYCPTNCFTSCRCGGVNPLGAAITHDEATSTETKTTVTKFFIKSTPSNQLNKAYLR